MEKTKIREAKNILKSIGMPTKQQSDICALTLLAMAQIFPDETNLYVPAGICTLVS